MGKEKYILWANYGSGEGWSIREQFNTVAKAKDYMVENYLLLNDTILTKRIDFVVKVEIDAQIEES